MYSVFLLTVCYMKIFFEGQYTMRPEMILQRAGYGLARTRVPSYQRRLSAHVFPRFHAYIDVTDTGFRINLHLDQKAACYTGTSAHSGEYDGELIAREADRIRAHVSQYMR
jgi:hypothetical protein